MFKSIFTLTVTLCLLAAPATIMAQEVYTDDDHTITFWDQSNDVFIIADASQNGFAIEIDFDPNKIEIDVNGDDYDLPIGQHEHVKIVVLGSKQMTCFPSRGIRQMRLCKHICRTAMTRWNATGTLS
jgi:hypothetical protein